MTYFPPESFTRLLQRSRSGERAALDELLPFVYDELRAVARRNLGRENEAQTLQPTALVNEVYLRLVDDEMAGLEDRAHFLNLCAREMRRILVDRARQRNAAKRDGGNRLEFESAVDTPATGGAQFLDVLAFDEALSKLAELDPRKAQVVELRYFSGLTVEEVAGVLDVSKRTVEGDWFFARAWLRSELSS